MFIGLLHAEELSFTTKQKEFLDTNKQINYVYDPTWKPFEWTSELSTHVGMIYDILYLVKQKSGLNLSPVHTQTWLESVELVKAGDVPMVSAIGITDTRKEYLTFSKKPLFKVPYVLVSRQGEDYLDGFRDAQNKKIATIESSTIQEILSTQRKGVKYSLVKSVKDGFYALQQKDIDLFVVNIATAKYYINFLGFKDLKIAYKTDLTLDLRVAVRKSSPVEILEIVDKSLENIDPKEIDNIFKKWTELKVKKEIDWNIIFYILVGVSIVISFLILHARKLNSMVGEQTYKINQQKVELEKMIASFDKYVIASNTDLKGNIIYASEAYCKISGYKEEELLGGTHSIVKHPDMSDEFFSKMWKRIESGKVWKGEIKNLAKENSTYWVETIISPSYNSEGTIVGYNSIRHDITDKKAMQELVITDALTNIYNRRYFNEIFPKFINGAKRDNVFVSFLSIDIDYFKAYNDTYGHQKGDEILIVFADTLKKSLNRGEDKCFRLGGEEFGIIFKPSSPELALKFALVILKRVEELHIVHKKSLTSKYITCSMGLVTKRAKEIVSIDTIYKETDDLLYQAKERGRNIIVSNSDNSL